MLRTRSRLLLLCLIVMLSACASKPKSEEERYQRLTNSVKYKAYRGVSKNTIDASMFALQTGVAAGMEYPPVRKEYIHTTLAMLQLLGGNNTLALAEADLAMNGSKRLGLPRDEATYLAMSMMSLALQHHGFKQMSLSYASAAKEITAEQAMSERFATAETYAKLLLGLNAALNEDAETSYVLLREASVSLNKPWLPRTVAAATLVMQNPYTAPFKLQTLLQEEALTAEEKLYISQLQQKIITGTPEQAKQKTQQMLADWLVDASKAGLALSAEAAYDSVAQLSEAMLRLVARN